MAKAKTNGKGKTRGRKSKAESVTGKKAGEVETRSGELDIPEPVIIASSDFQFYLKAAKSATEKKDTAVNLLRGVYKQAQKLHKQLPGALKRAIEIERADDHADLRGELEVLGIALREIGCPIQITISDTLLGDVKDQAFKRGRKDAELGKFASSPYPADSDLSQEYSRGWEAMTAERVNGAGGADESEADGDGEFLDTNGAEALREEAHA